MCRNVLVITVIWKRVFQRPGSGQTWRSRVWFWQVSGTTQTGRLLLSEIRTEGIHFHTVQTRMNWSICERCINHVNFTFTLLMKRVSDSLLMLVRGSSRLWFRGEMTGEKCFIHVFKHWWGWSVFSITSQKERSVPSGQGLDLKAHWHSKLNSLLSVYCYCVMYGLYVFVSKNKATHTSASQDFSR